MSAGVMMVRRVLFVCFLVGLAGCAPRGLIEFGDPAPEAAVHDIWVANLRSTEPVAPGQRVRPRPSELRYETYRVSVPPIHEVGQIEWPRQTPNAATDFVTVQAGQLPDQRAFARMVAASDKENTGETILFVHGFNYTNGEAIYQLAQITHDFRFKSPTVLFSWPSAGVPSGYLYDRDSVLFARDQLENLIVALSRKSGRKLVLVGHSLGNLLIMETLRQMEIGGRFDIAANISALFMISPDIDGELFYEQASRIRRLPDPTVILAAREDRVLFLSALLTGKRNRLGSQTDRSSVRDLPVAVVDVSDLSDGGLSHSVALTSPTAISILTGLDVEMLRGKAEAVSVFDLGSLLSSRGGG